MSDRVSINVSVPRYYIEAAINEAHESGNRHYVSKSAEASEVNVSLGIDEMPENTPNTVSQSVLADMVTHWLTEPVETRPAFRKGKSEE